MVGCSDSTEKKAKVPEKPAEPVTGRSAFYKMYGVAVRTWAQDVQGLRCTSMRMEQLADQPGKAPAWECTFVSPSKGQSRSYTYAVVTGEGNLHKDVFAGFEERWAGPTPQSMPWVIQAFKVDSDDAYQTALKQSAEYVKKNPGKPITYVLEQTKQFPDVVWRVIWGTSVGTSNYSVYVDATTGMFLEKAH
jgi:hypothetical protein